MKNIGYIISLLITMPIWFYLVYIMLEAANPDRLVWFLYYMYVPISVLASLLVNKIYEDK